jgi:DNA-binding response OmpR family regulator
MRVKKKRKQILIVERQEYWGEFAANALVAAGFSVSILRNYDHCAFDHCVHQKTPDLVVLGCAGVEPDDQEMVEEVLRLRCPLLVFCTDPPWEVMHYLFRAGASDVVDKPYDPDRLINIVVQTLASVSPRSCYQAVAQQGVA